MKIKQAVLIAVGIVIVLIITNYLIRNFYLVSSAVNRWYGVRAETAIIEAPATGQQGVVVSTQKDATQAGLQVLKAGGNAIDAAVAVGYALAVTDPCCGNIGGGGFMLVHLADGTETFIDFRETAPQQATADMYLDDRGNLIPDLSTDGYLAVGVPGTVKGLNYALDKYGTKKRSQVMEPAINLARDGYVLQEGDIEIFRAGKKRLVEPEVAQIFLQDGKQTYQAGDTLVQSDLAQTLSLIAESESTFYEGEIAAKVVAASEANNGILNMSDFANYQVRESEPVSCNYRGYQVTSSSPPGGGTTVCQMLNILSGYDLQKLGNRTPQSLHHMFAAMLLAFGDRNRDLGDPDFVNNPLERLLSKDYAESLRQKIAFEAIDPKSVYTTDVQQEGSNTTHYSVVDGQGNAVAVTYTINSFFGAGVVAPGTGFLLNNEMDDFTAKVGAPNQFGLRQGDANLIEPGKRPLSSMSPTIVTQEGRLVLVTGSPGGSTIPTTVLQVITNLIDYNFSLQDAVNTPRLHYQGFPQQVFSEPDAIAPETLRGLQLRGYDILPLRQWGAAESILIQPDGTMIGVNDRRRSAGQAAAY
ncbi:MAG: gamma-glutamyltransferase [Cyanobacteria bacterium J06621_8]